MVFLLAMCAFQEFKKLKWLLILVSAFTVGHSLTLILSVFEILVMPSDVIEFLIPLSIFLTAMSGFLNKNNRPSREFLSAVIVIFGLIHGMGFSNYLKSLLGDTESVILELFSFNVGIELGQILIVLIILLIKYVVESFLPIDVKNFRYWISGMAAGIALILMMETKFW